MAIRSARCALASAGLALASLPALLGACLLPVRLAPAVEGRVLDAASAEPLAGAIVVVRFDGRHGELVPDRELLGHAEAVTDAAGHFRIAPGSFPGLQAWPYSDTEARIVSVLREGYHCAGPRTAPRARSIRIGMVAAVDPADRRESCRPVPARRGEASRYMAAWRSLHEPGDEVASAGWDQAEQLLAARSVLGFGENCEGPAFDLALAPSGRHVGVVVERNGRRRVEVAELTATGPGRLRSVADARQAPPRRLAWTGAAELVLWEPAWRPDRPGFAPTRERSAPEVVWRPTAAPPRAAGDPGRTTPTQRPLEPEDLNDEAGTRRSGRSFALTRSLDPATGLARERLIVRHEDGHAHTVDLPGEACGPRGSFGRPHERIAVDGRTSLDLRYVDGGCRAVWIDLESGEWTSLDDSRAKGTCRTERRIPPGHLGLALRGYLRQLSETVEAGGADPSVAYLIRIGSSGDTSVDARVLGGETRRIPVPPFPVSTPLRAIHVANVAPPLPVEPAPPPPELEPL